MWLDPARGFLSDEFYGMAGLGALYSRASSYIFADWNKCGELMGLAPYGRPGAIGPMLSIADGNLRVPEWGPEFDQPHISDGGVDWEKSPAMQHWQVRAWRIQDDAETVLLARARWLRETTGAKNLCMAGGVALNCVANGRIAREAGFENVWIQPAAGDDGVAIGCAYYGHLALQGKPRSYVQTHAYYGRLLWWTQDVCDATGRYETDPPCHHSIEQQRRHLPRYRQGTGGGQGGRLVPGRLRVWAACAW